MYGERRSYSLGRRLGLPAVDTQIVIRVRNTYHHSPSGAHDTLCESS